MSDAVARWAALRTMAEEAPGMTPAALAGSLWLLRDVVAAKDDPATLAALDGAVRSGDEVVLRHQLALLVRCWRAKP